MMVATEAQDAWCPPTFSLSRLGRRWLAWWMVQLESQRSLRSIAASMRSRSSPAAPAARSRTCASLMSLPAPFTAVTRVLSDATPTRWQARRRDDGPSRGDHARRSRPSSRFPPRSRPTRPGSARWRGPWPRPCRSARTRPTSWRRWSGWPGRTRTWRCRRPERERWTRAPSSPAAAPQTHHRPLHHERPLVGPQGAGDEEARAGAHAVTGWAGDQVATRAISPARVPTDRAAPKRLVQVR